jgi:hypothetical protein
MNEGKMLRPALTGGVLLGILSVLPGVSIFNCVCCAWVIGGGLLAAYLYVKDSPAPVTLGRGVVLGLLTGVIGAIVSALFAIPLSLLMNKSGASPMEQIKQSLEQLPNLPPESRAILQNLSSRGDLFIWLMVFSLIFMIVIYGLFGMVGGAVGVALFEKRTTAAPPENTLPYQPPTDLPPPPPDVP